MTINPILDYDFKKNDRARLLYWSSDGVNSHSILVKITDVLFDNYGKWYLVKCHIDNIKKTTIDINELKNQNCTDNNENSIIFMVEPDELEPCYQDLKLIVNNKEEQ